MKIIHACVLTGFLMAGFWGGWAAVASAADSEFKVGQGEVLTPPGNENKEVKHWLFVECDYWAGCYMPCLGTLKACLNVAQKAKWTVISVFSQIDDNTSEADSTKGPVALPMKP